MELAFSVKLKIWGFLFQRHTLCVVGEWIRARSLQREQVQKLLYISYVSGRKRCGETERERENTPRHLDFRFAEPQVHVYEQSNKKRIVKLPVGEKINQSDSSNMKDNP